MKLTQSLAFIITGVVSFVIPFALADFDLKSLIQIGHSDTVINTTLHACPGAAQFGCECRAGATISSGGKELQVITESLISFSVDPGLCGMGKLDVYNQNNGSWTVYVSGGDGTIRGTCSPERASIPCDQIGFNVSGVLYCISDICHRSDAV